jgi:V8-like Glu-specific endopeptidase
MLKRFSVIFIVVVLALSVVGSTSVSASDQNAGATTLTPSGPDLSAARAWTTAEMLAAKPYPLVSRLTSALPTVDTLAGPTGAAGSIAGGRPASAAATTLDTSADFFSQQSGVSPLGYSYAPPFTRQDLRNITTPYTKWPFVTIGKLFFTQNDGSWVCSASSIASSSASHAIITAGHCINDGAGHWSSNMVFVPAYNNGAAPYGQWTIIYSTERAFTSWISGADLARDIAGAKVNNNDSGHTLAQTVGWLGFAWNFSRVNAWWQIGYPQAAPFTGKWMIACQASYAYDSPFGTTPKPMGVGCDQTGGTSGGPWVLGMGGGDYVNGVQSHRRTGFNSELYSPYVDGTVKTALWDLLVAP